MTDFHTPLKLLLWSLAICCSLLACPAKAANRPDNPVSALLERVAPGSSDSFEITINEGSKECFRLSDADGGKIRIEGDSYLSVAVGLNWYLKYFCGIHLSWGNMQASLPKPLSKVGETVVRSSSVPLRYYLNYCTYSYSMPYWDEARWREEIDWMALHGINLALVTLGTDAVWSRFLKEEGLDPDSFVAGSTHQAWWLMNNLEGYGGPVSQEWLRHSLSLARRVLSMMREWDMEAMLPGFSGMMPHDANKVLGYRAYSLGKWQGFQRPELIAPEDPSFADLAEKYYRIQEEILGTNAKYYSMDPGHEGALPDLDKKKLAYAVTKAMRRHNPSSVWTLQAWGGNPDPEIVRSVPTDEILLLDLSSPAMPRWGDPHFPTSCTGEFEGRDWVYCMLLNYGGNEGLFGRASNVIRGFYDAKAAPAGKSLKGIGLTMEGIENNPVMYELLLELPWRDGRFTPGEWIRSYVPARYGAADPDLQRAWDLLFATIYDCPESLQQGTTESIFCSRPSLDVRSASAWVNMTKYYDSGSIILAARRFAQAADRFRLNDRYTHDLVDITRQAVADAGRLSYDRMVKAAKRGDADAFEAEAEVFLSLLLNQDRLLGTRREFRFGNFFSRPAELGLSMPETALHETNIKRLLTTWGDRIASEEGNLRDYAHREWQGLLKDVYYPRWRTWILAELQSLRDGTPVSPIDWYGMDEAWILRPSYYDPAPEGDSVETALEILRTLP